MAEYNNALHATSLAFDRSVLLRFMCVSLFMLMMLDITLTYAGVVYMNGIEGNILCAYLGLETFIALKIVAASLLPPAVYAVGKTQFGIAAAGCTPLIVLYAAIAVNNVIMLGLVG